MLEHGTTWMNAVVEHATGSRDSTTAARPDCDVRPGAGETAASSRSTQANTERVGLLPDALVGNRRGTPVPSLTALRKRPKRDGWLPEQAYLLGKLERVQNQGDLATMRCILQDPVSSLILHGVCGRNGDRLTALGRRCAPDPAAPALPSGLLLAALASCRDQSMEHFVERLMARKQDVETSLTRKLARILRVQRRFRDNAVRRQE